MIGILFFVTVREGLDLQLKTMPASIKIPQWATALLVGAMLACSARAQVRETSTVWKPVDFAIVRLNDDAPKSWNLYHTEKRGLLLLHIWKRYLLVDIQEREVFDIDPQTVKPHGSGVEWPLTQMPSEALEIAEWKERNVGPVARIRFRFGKEGHVLELQLPQRPDGKPAY
ncbi:MAG: hypothetical protein NVS9B4_24620 [Candidatus Acidiferrum sp.]